METGKIIYSVAVIIGLIIMWVVAIVKWNRRRIDGAIMFLNIHYSDKGVDFSGMKQRDSCKFEYDLLKIARWYGKKEALFYAYKIGYAEAKLEEIENNEEK